MGSESAFPEGGRPASLHYPSAAMTEILEAVLAGAPGEELARLPLPESYRAAYVRREDVGMLDGLESEDKDPRKSLQVGEVPLPELAPAEAYVAGMASSINLNTVWTSIFEPLPTFGFLERLGRESPLARRHDLAYHVVGSDASGVVLRTGSAVWEWKPGDRVVVRPANLPAPAPESPKDTALTVAGSS